MLPALATTEPSDRDLLLAARAGDQAPLQHLARRWWPDMYRWAYRELGDATLAEDAAQDALVRVVRFHHQCDPDRPFEAWLRVIVRNCARDQRGKRGMVLEHPARAATGDLERRTDLRRAAARARDAFNRLPDRQRQIIELCDHQGLEPTEAAARLDMPPSTARVLLHRARRAVRTRILDLHVLLEEG